MTYRGIERVSKEGCPSIDPSRYLRQKQEAPRANVLRGEPSKIPNREDEIR